mgnify:CR=1 FL=1
MYIEGNVQSELYKCVIQRLYTEMITLWATFRYILGEALTEYRARLRVLCEDLVLYGDPRPLTTVVTSWQVGLRGSVWHQ